MDILVVRWVDPLGRSYQDMNRYDAGLHAPQRRHPNYHQQHDLRRCDNRPHAGGD